MRGDLTDVRGIVERRSAALISQLQRLNDPAGEKFGAILRELEHCLDLLGLRLEPQAPPSSLADYLKAREEQK